MTLITDRYFCRFIKWFYTDIEIEVVDSFDYIGLTLNFNGIFLKSQSIIGE
jgi:hypothetical protein